MGLRRSTAWLTALLVLGAVLPGCHSKPHAGAAGVGLRDGLVVAPNARLAGAVFDDPDGQTWRALLDIERDPVGVYDAFVTQARKLRVPLSGSGTNRLTCARPPGATTTVTSTCQPTPTCYLADAMFQCTGYAVRSSGPQLAITITLVWGRATRHLLLTVSHGASTGREIVGTDRLVVTAPLPAAQAPAPVTVVGRPFGAENNAFARGRARFTLETGSRVVSDARRLGIVILEVTGEAGEVLARYARQLSSTDTPPHAKTVRLTDGATILWMAYSPDGGGSAVFNTDASHHFVELTDSSD